MTEQTIQANHNPLVDTKEFKFRFKADKLGNTRKPVTIIAQVPSVEGIIEILQKGGKSLEMLQDAIYDYIRPAIASAVADDENFSQETFDQTKFTWEAIANQPREDRRANSIPKEVWEAFGADYIEVMQSATGKNSEQLGNAVQVYLKKFSQVKTNKDVLNVLKGQLGIYMENSKKAEDFIEILDMLLKRVETLLKSDEVEQLVANL